jgi:hypothetical protein
MRISALVVVLGLSAAPAGAATTKTIDRTLPLPATGSVVLDTHNGSIDVHTWDRAEIEIHARIEAAGPSSADARRVDDTTVDITSSADSVRISSRYPTVGVWWSWFGLNPTIHYTISAPRTARWTIYDHNARAEVHDLHAALNVHTHNGSIHAVGLDGPLQVDAHNGSVTADFVSFRGADVTTHNGSVEFLLPSAAAFDLHADTYHASVQSDFPVSVQHWGRRQTRLEGAASGGGPTLNFRSHLGELRLRRKG